jgi:hypothetical protein
MSNKPCNLLPCATMRGNAAGMLSSRSRTSAREQRLRQKREELLAAAKRRDIDLVVVWRLDRWGRSLVDLVNTPLVLAQAETSFAHAQTSLRCRPSCGLPAAISSSRRIRISPSTMSLVRVGSGSPGI